MRNNIDDDSQSQTSFMTLIPNTDYSFKPPSIEYPISATQNKRNNLTKILTKSYTIFSNPSLIDNSRIGEKPNLQMKKDSKDKNYDLTWYIINY